MHMIGGVICGPIRERKDGPEWAKSDMANYPKTPGYPRIVPTYVIDLEVCGQPGHTGTKWGSG